MNLIKPKKLKRGDTIGFLAISGETKSKAHILRAKKYFENKGYNVVFSQNIFDKKRYLAGEDEIKIQELHRFFSDPNIDAILCSRGGYGVIRLLDKIDWEIIKQNPKIFAGYSDISAMSAMIYKKTGLITFSSPMAQSDFGCGSRSEPESSCGEQDEQGELNDSDVRVFKRSAKNSTGAIGENVSKTVEASFFKTLTNTGDLELKPDSRKSKVYFEGKCEGTLWGGNVTTIATLCGQDFIPDEKFIFFAEDLNADVYQIDRTFTQLLNIEKFKNNLQGIVMGDFLDVTNKKFFDELFFEIGDKYKIPILSGFKITHAADKITVPYGAQASFSTRGKCDKTLKIQSYLI